MSRYKGCGGAVAAAQVSGDGSLLAVCGLDRYLRVYRLERPTLLHQVGRGGRNSRLIQVGPLRDLTLWYVGHCVVIVFCISPPPPPPPPQSPIPFPHIPLIAVPEAAM